MLRINKGEPWVMWPDSMVANFIEDPANKVFDYEGDFTFSLSFNLTFPVEEKSTLFSKLPSYFGVDLERNGLVLLYTYRNTDTKYEWVDYSWKIETEYIITLRKSGNILELLVNDEKLLILTLTDILASDNNSHIIFAAGNFPKNGFNLNYLDVNLNHLTVEKQGTLISKHNFETFIHNKSFDITGNCNFIHKI